MRKLLTLIIGLLLTLSVSGQIMPGVVASRPAVVAGGAVYTDDFEAYSNATLAGQGSWISGLNDMYVLDVTGDNRVVGYTTTDFSAVIYNADFANDQYAQIVIDAVGSTHIGIGVRMSGTGASLDGYTLIVRNSQIYLHRWDNGTSTVLASDLADNIGTTIGDVFRLEISGTTLSCFKNGSLITLLDTDGMVTDNTYASGKAGIAGYADATTTHGDLWEGGDL